MTNNQSPYGYIQGYLDRIRKNKQEDLKKYMDKAMAYNPYGGKALSEAIAAGLYNVEKAADEASRPLVNAMMTGREWDRRYGEREDERRFHRPWEVEQRGRQRTLWKYYDDDRIRNINWDNEQKDWTREDYDWTRKERERQEDLWERQDKDYNYYRNLRNKYGNFRNYRPANIRHISELAGPSEYENAGSLSKAIGRYSTRTGNGEIQGIPWRDNRFSGGDTSVYDALHNIYNAYELKNTLRDPNNAYSIWYDNIFQDSMDPEIYNQYIQNKYYSEPDYGW